ncbi:hypothetical protein N657DRAFT_682128 [Parathielavia appendiculata]|uniref:Uncharacterized protein n=1 Tax=Parathielavia appendiculata TaxID=2587402 RepID=A0AAN6TY93_9PEZI|nr:hypothetical protein N657DRAFT_682128 [Parathielavia appendiculata]
MLAANAALKRDGSAAQLEAETAATERPSFGRRLLRKISTPSFSLFSKNKPADAEGSKPRTIQPHNIRHLTGGLAPLPLSGQAELVPDAQLRLNETGNVLAREKALRVLGDGPKLAPAPSPANAPADPFSPTPRSTRLPTEFETRLRPRAISDGSLTGPPLAHNPFASERVMTSALDSCLPGPPEGSPAPPRPAPFEPTTTRPITTASSTTAPPTIRGASRSFSHADVPQPALLPSRHPTPSHDATRRTLGTVSTTTPTAVATAVPSVLGVLASRVSLLPPLHPPVVEEYEVPGSSVVLLPPPPPHQVLARGRRDTLPRRKRHPAPARHDLERLEREFVAQFPGVVFGGDCRRDEAGEGVSSSVAGYGEGSGDGSLSLGDGTFGPFGAGSGVGGGEEEVGGNGSRAGSRSSSEGEETSEWEGEGEEEGQGGLRPLPGFF